MTQKGFVPLSALAGKGPSTPAQVLDEIRTIYFKTTRATIQNDLAHAVELLKSLPDEDTRSKAAVYMEGLAQMRREWFGSSGTRTRGAKAARRKATRGTS